MADRSSDHARADDRLAVILAGKRFFTGFSEAWHDWDVTPLTVFTALALMPLQYSQNKDTADIKAYLHTMAECLKEVDEKQAKARVAEEEKP